jgi:glutamyl-tRNA reductase
MLLTAFGLNYQTAPLTIREKIAFGTEQLPAALNALLGLAGVQEAAILSTCNRTEIYCNASQPEKAIEWLAAHYQLEKKALLPYLYRFNAEETARHAFRVASGLDSMVLGEAQILGQLKEAVRIAQDNGALGSLLNGLFQRAFQVAKEVRTQTQIGSNSVSMAAACLRLAERIFPTIEECHILFIGAGKMITLCATYFAAQHPKSIRIANRTRERGEELAQKVGGQAILLTDLPDHLADYDIVISSTASALPIVGKGMIEGAIRKRRRKPIFMVDLAVPRDIEAEAGQLNDVYLYTVDDLASLVEEARDARSLAAIEAESIINVQVEDFTAWLQSRAIVPTIRDLKDSAERVRRNEVLRAKKMLAKGASLEDILDALSQGMMNKYLHAPLMTLHQASANQQDELINLIRRIYHLHDAD